MEGDPFKSFRTSCVKPVRMNTYLFIQNEYMSIHMSIFEKYIEIE